MASPSPSPYCFLLGFGQIKKRSGAQLGWTCPPQLNKDDTVITMRTKAIH